MKKIVTKEVIKQPRRLTHGLYKMSVIEKRVILRIIEALQKDISSKLNGNKSVENNLLGDKIIKIKTKSLMKEGSKNSQRLKKALAELPLRRVYLKCYDKNEGEYEVFTGFILQSKFFERNSVVEIQISRDMLPIYMNIVNGYTAYKLSVAFNLSSINTIRIYELLCSWLTFSSDQQLSFEELKSKLGLNDKYKNSAQFKKKVLETAQKELKEKADVWFEIKEPIKSGKKVIGWQIQIFKKETQNTKSQANNQLPEPPAKKHPQKIEEKQAAALELVAGMREQYNQRNQSNARQPKKTLKPKNDDNKQ